MNTSIQKFKIVCNATVITAMIAILAYASPALAMTDVTLSSVSTDVVAGQSFNVAVNISPAGETAYTSKVALSYSSDLLNAGAFSFAPNWLPLSQPGYDSIDQVSGTIVKTGGYTKGIASGTSQPFGMITFTAIRSGTAVIAVAAGTQIYDSNSKNVYSGSNSSIQIAISPARIRTVAVATTTVKSPATTTPQVAAASTTGSVSYSLISVIILIALGAIGYFYYRKSVKNQL